MTGSAQESREYPFGRGVVKWVSTQWLEDHLKDPNLTIIDTQPDVHDYVVEHIRNAVYLSDFTLQAPKDGLPVQYIPSDAIRLLFRRIGLDNDDPVVVYTAKGAYTSSGSGLGQTMLAYTLARFGHNRVYVLDGGLDKWKREGRPVTQEFPTVTEGRFRPTIRDEYFVDMEELKKIKDRGDVILLDARPAKLYQGKGPWIKQGHIPGAVSLPWRSLMADDNATLLKSDDQIDAILKGRNISPDKTVIVSCGTGREATSEFLLFKWYLGYPNVKIYEGSFTEWCAYPENPTVAGVSPR
ncbi:MAG: thiosulfate sulfurtransferase [Planctomycetes bacterium RBG_13_62_9]|nr:MAG: thiosulfate sulfurtransferase [Planctomycetes bacterium RBG_13_62_9]